MKKRILLVAFSAIVILTLSTTNAFAASADFHFASDLPTEIAKAIMDMLMSCPLIGWLFVLF